MNNPGLKYRTRTLFIEDVLNDIINKANVEMRETFDDYADDTNYIDYLYQDVNKAVASAELLYNLGFITRDELDDVTAKIYNLHADFSNMVKTA